MTDVGSEIETPKDLLRRIYDEEFGFIPTNASMKPVHVANGMARSVQPIGRLRSSAAPALATGDAPSTPIASGRCAARRSSPFWGQPSHDCCL